MANVASELVWLRSFLAFLDQPARGHTVLYCDNQAALHIAANPLFHERAKHIETDSHFVRERLLKGEIKPCYVPSRLQLADFFTKALGSRQFHSLLGKFGIYSVHAPT